MFSISQEKNLKLVEQASAYHFDIVEVSSTKKHGPGIEDLNSRWKLFYSHADQTMFAHASPEILAGLYLSDCVYTPNTVSKYQVFRE